MFQPRDDVQAPLSTAPGKVCDPRGVCSKAGTVEEAHATTGASGRKLASRH